MDRDALRAWIAAYERLWRTPGTGGLSEIFTDDVVYSMSPFEEPVRGLDRLGELWERERHSADEDFELVAEPLAVDGDVAVVRVDVSYAPPRDREYKDLWVIRFGADGRCESFEEWPYWPGQQPMPEVER